MSGVLRSLRKLVLGETWTLPCGIALSLGAAFAARELAGREGWWVESGGFLLLGLLVAVLTASLGRALRRP